MNLLSIAAILLTTTAPPHQAAQTFRLEPGDFRWIPFNVRQTPTGVDCRYVVTKGGRTVHAELLPMSEFRLFDRGREHETLALTTPGGAGEFRRILNERGSYAVVIVNDREGASATVSLTVETSLNPSGADVARTLSPTRRLTVILVSFAFFFITVSLSGRALMRAMRDAGRSSIHRS